MQTWFLLMVLLLAGAHGGGVTKTDEDGVTQRWSENIKELEHLYGKTSDKDFYGEKLPPSVTFDAAKIKFMGGALEKTQRLSTSDLTQAKPTYPYNHNYDDEFNNQFKKLEKPKRSNNYISYSDFKPISHIDVSNTYNYLKLGQREKQNTQGSGVFEPSFSYVGRNPEESDAYRNNQDILYTSEANKVRESGSKEKLEENRNHVTNKDRSKLRPLKGKTLISRTICRAGVCRKKITDSNRLHARPTVKKIKRIVYNY
ncbi:unnamed protein product [Parnassius mnemosyne]|uniref:Uncharacterized protein n=1 Tax=Parnassius mnemosyne TaxID=213953 RepID=A0AAV1KSY9_9NEOP